MTEWLLFLLSKRHYGITKGHNGHYRLANHCLHEERIYACTFLCSSKISNVRTKACVHFCLRLIAFPSVSFPNSIARLWRCILGWSALKRALWLESAWKEKERERTKMHFKKDLCYCLSLSLSFSISLSPLSLHLTPLAKKKISVSSGNWSSDHFIQSRRARIK